MLLSTVIQPYSFNLIYLVYWKYFMMVDYINETRRLTEQMEERKESYSLIKNGENAKLPTLSILPDIGRYRRKCSETLLMSYSLQQKGEFSVNIALAEIYSHAKGRVSSSCLPVSQERKQYLPQIVFRQTLNRSAQMNWPPFMTAAWKKIIWDRIPRNLVIKFSSVNAEIEKEVDFLYEKTLQSHGTSERIKLSSAEEQHYITEKEYRKGFSENYSQFLITRTFIEQRLLLRHNLMVKVLEMSVTHVQQLLNDYTKYRSKGPLSLMGWRTNMSNDLRKGENLLQQGMYNKIAKLFLKQGCLDDLPKEYWPQFMKCATYIMVNQILELKKRTLGNVVNMTGDMHKVPYLKIDLVYEEEEGILLIPSQKAIISAFLEIVDDIVRVAEKLDPLESWVSVPVPPGFINVKLLEEHTMEAKRIIQENILKLYSPIENYRHELVDKFSPLYDVALRLELEVFISSENKKFKESCDKIKNLKTFYYKIMELPSNKMFNVVKVNQIDVIKNMMSIYSNYSSRILNELLARHQEQNRRICGRFEQLGCRALTPPKSTEELMEMGKYMVWATSTFMDHIKEEIQRVIKEFSRMIDMTTVTEEHTNLNTETVLWLNNIKPVFQQNALLYEQYKIKFEDDLTKTTDLLVKEIEDLFPRLSVLDMMDDADKVHEYITMIRWFCRKIEHFDETIAWINKEECLFQFPYSTYPELDELKAIIHPFGELIFLIHKWHRTHKLWMDGDFEFIVAKEVEERTEEFHQGLVKTQKMYRERLRQQTTENYPRRFKGNVEDPEFVNLPAPIKLCMKAIDNIRDFQQNIGLVKIMCNPALTQRHWDEMSEIAGLDLTPDAGTTLRKIINMKLEKYLDKFEIISISAMKEKQLKENLMKMLHEWTEIKFTVIMWKETDILILSQFDEIEAIMDDHLVKTLSMRGSAFVKPFEGEVRKWYVTLLRMIQTTDEWGKVQHQWLYLLPFFSSPVITSEIPEEGLLFNEVDSNYKKLMASVKKDPRVTETAGVLGTYETLHTCTENLERINKGLNAYLENKRLYFPRFYFLSNFEMLEILSKMKDPLKVQPHLNKCFDGISKLDFDEHLCIKAMFSEQGEKIDFVSPIYTKAARGSVEKWLIQVENQMTASVRDKIVKSYNEYPESEYTHWILKWPGQVVLCVSLIYWTLQVHQLLRPNTLDSLKSYCNELQTKLNQVVALVSGKLTVQARITLGSYIVLHAHAKEIVEELINKNASSAKDFQWIAHLRYFWEQDVKVCIVNATVNYAYEYLGNTTRLVVTPLTDRCYRTIIGAHYLHLNGAPEGPAGTGKTETVKDLAKALGIRCVVFNCSDGLNYITVGKFFKGLASSGCWACFDEFNRIEVEVLSVIAQQILSVTDAVRAGLNNFTLEGSELKLNPTSFICITMNPECAECSELPDNLKVLFRTVAMTVPDVTLISEISLYSYGYVNARNLAVKIVTTCHLCSAQLSPHNHYDYGLRAVKFVLVTAGNLKQISPDVEEESLIMRALIDSNISKLVTQDIAVFEAIISDLFPIAFMSASNHNNLLNAAREVCKTRFLQPTEVFLLKLIQTYEVMTVYHGFMLIGDSFGGKSTTLKVLADSLSLMCKGDECGNAVIYEIINPRCLTIDQLYGHFDPILHEWTDGIISQIFREFSADESDARKWIIFDGPVDSSWIENMNTVLDDNKKLCLTSGEVIHQTKHMSMIFEVMDLAQASPAIVSRCGMIHMESSALGWKPLVLSWIVKGNPAWRDGNEKLLEDMFDWLAPPCLEFIQKHCVQLVSPGISNLIKSATLLIQMLLEEAVEQNEDTKPLRSWIQAAYFFAGVWSFGGILDGDSQIKFDEFYKSIWKGYNQDYPIPESIEKVEISIPLEGILYDYVYNFKLKGNWKNWPEILKGIKIEDSVNIQSPIPTSESLRYRFLMDMHIRNNLPVLLVGPSGAGKTFYIHNMLTYKLCDEKYMPAFIPFTSQTTGNGTQELFISKLNKRGKNCYGPSNGKKCVIFIDDMDIPAKQISGETSAIELLRQFFDHGHWYDLKTKSKIFVLDILILAAVGLPQNCWQEIKRCLHHFSIYSVNPVSAESICRIYTNILLLSLKRNGFAADVVSSVTSIINATLDVYEGAICHLLPTPTKCHYTFNLRDFSRVIQGCVLLKKESLDSKKLFIKLWVHEVLRVFYDRLVEPEDRTWLYNKLQHSVEEHFNEQFDGCLDTLPMENGKVTEDSLRHLLFGNFMNPSASVEDRKYEEITSLDALTRIAEIALTEYNSMHNPKMDIVLFRYALEHLCHICRIIALPSGSGLLIGVGGSGRQSLTRLAAAIQGTAFYQPDITKNYGVNEWRDNLKKILREAGGFARETTFLLSDSQIKEEEFLQDIDSLLNCGEIPNLYNVDEEQEILEIVRLTAQGGNRNLDISPLSVFSFFISRCKQKMHLILCFSPIGSALRKRMMMYPSLVKSCMIDWFTTWPEDALEMVAQRYMVDINLPFEIKAAAVSACKYFHVSARKVSEEYLAQEGRKSYITSASYLELIHSFTELTNEKQNEIMQAKLRYIGGLDKLDFAAEQVAAMQEELSELKPQLVLAAEGTRRMMKEIEKETIKVEAASNQVREDEKVANVQAAKAQELKIECEADLAQAIPILEDAIAALNTLKPTDITLVKSMKNPPDAIKLVMAAVCVMKNVKADRIIDSSTGRMINDYWGPSKRVLGDMYFLQSLKEFDKDNIAPSIMKKIRTEYLPNKDFKPSVVAKASSAAEGLCKWVIAMDMYDKVAKEVSPKKAKLEIAEAEYNATMALLEEKRNQLRTLEEQLADLHHKLNEANQRKQALEDDVTLCANKLKRAEKLIGGLGGEKARWSAAADALQKDYDSLAGDILICCGVICYLSPFTSSYRNKCIDDWRAYVSDLNIPCSEEFSFRKVLGSDIKIQAWNIAGLPNDSFSVENAIIVDTSRRYSLLIDPQGQANRWIKALEKLSGLKTVKCMNNGFTKTLHNCIEFGYPLLLENVGEVLEASLEPILMKQIFQQGETLCVKIGDTVLEYNPTFRLYLTSKLINPHFMPHVFNRVTIVNFALTLEGLEDQLLGIVVAKERPYLEETRRNLIVQSAANETALKDVEDGILITLSETKGNILEDESAINVLDSSKALAQGIKKREAKAQESASMIENFRFSFRQIARHSAILYYCLTDLPNIDPMYQYSLEWFINLYSSSIERSNKARDVNKRMEYIADAFTYNLYTNVSLSLFEKDKLLFSFVLCTNIMMAKEKLSKDEFKFFVTGVPASEKILENPEPSWLPNKCWNEICHLDIFPKFEGFLDSFVSSVENWKIYYDNVDSLEVNMPEPWNEKLSNFQKLIIIKIFHPDKILHAIQNFVQNEMGGKYVAPPAFDIAKSFEYSNCLCPLIFVLSPGADPMTSLVTFSRKMGKNLHSVSLGQGQGPLAQKIIKKGQEGGHWVCLQNCHLAVSWMPVLEKLWEEMNINNTSLNFRLWLTSYPSDKFPTGILQAGVKMTTEPPTGLQQSLLRSFMSEPIKESDFFSGCPGKEKEFSKLLYSLCFFHAVIQERKKFGSIGWNIPYGFDESDFQISLQQLQIFINEHDAIPFEIIVYLIGECNYGGRVSDDWDRRTLKTVLADFISEEVVTDEDYNFTNVGSEYGLPYHCEYRHFLHHIKGIPLVPSPEVFGLHTNAGITKDLRYGKEFFDAVLEVYGWIAVGRKEEDIMETNDILLQNIADILNKIPPVFDLDLAKAAYPARYEESLNVVLVKELEHLNVLLNTISTSLITLQKALKGFVMMSSELEAISSSLLMGKVPHSWKKASLPSSKPLGSYINDVLLCHENFHKWFAHGLPSCFWLPGFFFTHSFLTAVQLNFARKFKVPIEKLSFDFFILSFDITPNQPEEGCYIIGLFLDGAHWNRDSHTIQESKPRILQEMMPPIHMIPKCKESVEIGDRYVCPVYKTQDRRGATSTLGHSNNYIFPILLNTSHPVSHWIKRGVALICQLED